MSYVKVLVAVDFGHDEAQRLIATATQITGPAQLTIAHVICLDLEHYTRTERLHSASLEEAYWCTRQHLDTLGTPLGLIGDQQRILNGNIVDELTHLVEAEAFDLVIVGHHANVSPASTAQSVAARASCDVLAVAID